MLLGDLRPVGVGIGNELGDLGGLREGGRPLLLGGLRLVLKLGIRLDEDVARPLLGHGRSAHRRDHDLRDAPLLGRADEDLGVEHLLVGLGHGELASVGAVLLVAHTLGVEELGQRVILRVAPLGEVEQGHAALDLDRADDVARLRIVDELEVLGVGRIVRGDPADAARVLGARVVAHVERDRAEVLPALDPRERVLGLLGGGGDLLLGGLGVGIRILGQRVDEDQVDP